MAFQPAPDCAKIAVVQTHITSDIVNVLHFRRQGQWGLPELDALITAVGTAWVNDIMPHLSANNALVRIEGRGLRGQFDVSSEYVLPTPVVGGRPGEGLPANVSFCVTHLTGLAGRSNRGRTYFGALAEADTVGDFIAVARAGALRDGLNSVRSAASQQGWTMVVLSRYANKQLRAQALPIDVIGFRYRDTIVDSQRRRLSRRGA